MAAACYGWLVIGMLLVGCRDRAAAPGSAKLVADLGLRAPGQPTAGAEPGTVSPAASGPTAAGLPAAEGEPVVDRLLRRLAVPGSATYSAEQVGELFELASLLTTRDRALATPERAQKTARIALQVLAGTTGRQQGTALAAIGALAAVWPAAQKALYSGGAVTQLQALLADEVAPRRRGQALFALGALFPEHERAGRSPAALAAAQAPDRALLRAGLVDTSRFVRRQAILGATLARDEALDAPLLAALRQQLTPGMPAAPDDPADSATLRRRETAQRVDKAAPDDPADSATLRSRETAQRVDKAAPDDPADSAALRSRETAQRVDKAAPDDPADSAALRSRETAQRVDKAAPDDPADSAALRRRETAQRVDKAAPDGPADPATLHIPSTLTPAAAAELLPLLPAFVDLLLSLPPPATAVALDKALQLTQVVAAASPRSATAQFLLAQVQSRRRDPAAVTTLRTALALGNLPGVFIEALGPDGRKLASDPDVPAARRQVRTALALRPRSRPRADLAPVVTAAELSSGQAQVAVVTPTELVRRAATVLAGPGVDSAAARTLGAELFASYPFGSEADYDSCLRSFLTGNNHDLIEALGLAAENSLAGRRQLVGIVDARESGATAGRYGVTCALCHAQVDAQGRRQDGLPSRTYDQGLLLAACFEQPIHYKSGNRNLDDLLDYRPGRNDSSSDGVHNPAEIPSLFGLRIGGAVRWNGDTPTLEVQIDRNLSARSAPPEVVTLVAAYLRGLPLPPAPPLAPGTAPLIASGSAVFARTCQRCHAPPAYTTGEIIPQPDILTDVTRVSAVLPNSSEGYKIPSLLRISQSAPYLHDGSVPTLEAMLERPRAPATGHPFGRDLRPAERRALLAFLRSL